MVSNRFTAGLAAATTLLLAYLFQSFVVLTIGTALLCTIWLSSTSVVAFAVLVAAATLFSVNLAPIRPSGSTSYVTGRNNTALFIVSEGRGLNNVHLATSQSLLERHPDIQLHFVTYPKMKSKLAHLSKLMKARQPLANDIVFHPITSGRPYFEATDDVQPKFVEGGLLSVIVPPWLPVIQSLVSVMSKVFAPWKPEEHLAIYNQICNFIDDVDPAIVVLDTVFSPGNRGNTKQE
ncbi:hypothetical protein NQ176_g4155 [Zarea fungicola]|uniref:Uncharacterized protein n=1 Tax=Zarea fungicola TaxID=93591 RepID=A0ACC1NG90_9HYPO|nr:hypothetical protein NQ176_g4155 [Lecanicillium fungicola]